MFKVCHLEDDKTVLYQYKATFDTRKEASAFHSNLYLFSMFAFMAFGFFLVKKNVPLPIEVYQSTF